MYSESDLEAAVAEGIFSTEAVNAFRGHVARTRAIPAVDEEHFRLLTGFNDIFVSIAAVILLVSVQWIGDSFSGASEPGAFSPLSSLLVAAAAWGLAEFFTRRRRMALPSIILLLAFVGGVLSAAVGFAVLNVTSDMVQNDHWMVPLLGAACAAAAAAAAWLHWWRFRVPITVAVGTAALVAVILGFVAMASVDMDVMWNALLVAALILGFAVFLLAMWWDSSDPARQTRRSDVAFWLHLLAAPLIVHPVFALLGLTGGQATTGAALAALLLYLALGFIALAIDRRALLVSALAYVLYALSSLIDRFGAVELSFALTALVIGSALLLLSAFWHNARVSVIGMLPPALRAKLPTTESKGEA